MKIVATVLLAIFLCIIERCDSAQLVDYTYLAKCSSYYPKGVHNNETRFNINEIYKSRPEGLFMDLTIYVLTWKNLAIQFYPSKIYPENYYEIVLSEEEKLSKVHFIEPNKPYAILTSINRANIFAGLDFTPVRIKVQKNGFTEIIVNNESTPLMSVTLPNPEIMQYVAFMSYWNSYSKVLYDCETAPINCTCSSNCPSSRVCPCKKDDIINDLAKICKNLYE